MEVSRLASRHAASATAATAACSNPTLTLTTHPHHSPLTTHHSPLNFYPNPSSIPNQATAAWPPQ
eukprot:scaffold32245_cov48-Phaeocystis_antarctica.AAC.1